MRSPAEIQRSFTDALTDPDRDAPAALIDGEGRGGSGFAVYRNNRVTSLIDALADTFPAVFRLVGEDFFRATARVFVDAHPPESPVLHWYGDEFGAFLDGFPPAESVPYLGDVARLEWACLCAYHAEDAAPIGIDALAAVPQADTPQVRLALHPALDIVASRWPIGSLWSAVCGAGADTEVDMASPEAVVVLRPELDVDMRVVSAESAVFINALGQGGTLEEATLAAHDLDPDFDLPTQLQTLFALGAVVAVSNRQEQQP